MKIVIVTGMSGAGKSTALKLLEDQGYYCVDNLPIQLLEKFKELALMTPGSHQDAALGIDIRNSQEFKLLESILEEWRKNSVPFTILYLDCSDDVLVKRFKATRRTHPLDRGGRVEHAIRLEREKLSFLKEKADFILETDLLQTKDLKKELGKILTGERTSGSFYINVLSFGFKYGIPADADLVFDVRFLPNPFYLEELRPLTGDNKEVQEYVMQGGMGEEFLRKLMDMLEFLLPHYVAEGKNQLVIAIGCTGGRHRSVTIANEVFKRLEEDGRYGVRLEHRDSGKDGRS